MIPTQLTAAQEVLAPGTMVGEYQIESRIGAGGMGVVYGARHPVIGKRAAIKVLSAKYARDREELERFVLEAQAVNRIGHPNIVDIFAFGHLPDGRWYFVMEWLVGETLAARLARSTPPLADTVAIVTSLCHALEAAHAAGIIHRDLKPENVFLPQGDDSRRIKLLDFGIAKLTGGDNANRTATGIVIGTPMYMSPEQASGAPLDAATDIYTLGVVLYAMVCGRTPFQDLRTGVEIMTAHVRTPPPPPRSFESTIPVELDRLLLAMLAKEPARRPALAEVRAQLAGLAAAPATPRRPPRRLGFAIGALILAGAAGAAVLVARGGDEGPAPRPIAPLPVAPPPVAPAASPPPVVAPPPIAQPAAIAVPAPVGHPPNVRHRAPPAKPVVDPPPPTASPQVNADRVHDPFKRRADSPDPANQTR